MVCVGTVYTVLSAVDAVGGSFSVAVLIVALDRIGSGVVAGAASDRLGLMPPLVLAIFVEDYSTAGENVGEAICVMARGAFDDRDLGLGIGTTQ